MHPFIEFAESNFRVPAGYGFVPFKAKKYHQELTQIFEDNRFVLVKKYRQGGFTAFAALWSLYNCLIKRNQHYLIFSINNNMCSRIYEILYYSFPLGSQYITNSIYLDNGSVIKLRSNPDSACGHALDCVIFDESAYIPQMENVYASSYPCLSLGGKAFGISTPNGKKNWFYKTYKSKKWFNYSPSVYDDPEVLEKAKELHMSSDKFSEEYLAKFSCC